MSDTAADGLLEKIKEALYAGRKIDAIKRYREARGVGLKEAKEHVEKLEKELREQSPERFKAAAGKGCLGVVLIALLVLAGVARLWW